MKILCTFCLFFFCETKSAKKIQKRVFKDEVKDAYSKKNTQSSKGYLVRREVLPVLDPQ